MQRPDPTGRLLVIFCKGRRTFAIRYGHDRHYCHACGKRVKVAW